MTIRALVTVAVLCLVCAVVSAQHANTSGIADPAAAETPSNPISKLQARIASGDVKLEFDEQKGYLPSVLRALDVPISSQGLVFSRTSLQVDRIGPWSPRALYFSDDVYVGWVQGGPILEIAVADPKLGGVFYTLDQERADHPEFQRQSHTCLQCHDSASSTGGVPGFIMRSVVTDRHGYPVQIDSGGTSDDTPLSKRWGGWYVTGDLGQLEHMGNAMAPALAHEMGSAQRYLARTPVKSVGGAASLSDRFDTEPYLSAHSDAVALLVFAHQTNVHNLITQVQFESRKAVAEGAGETLTPRVRAAAERLLRALFFVKEAQYGLDVKGTSSFAADFPAKGPRDDKGRSLRDLDLHRRLFRYPLSYLIYSTNFDALPDSVKTYVAERIRDVLTGVETSSDFSHLSADDHRAILEILRATKPEFAGQTAAR
jgi:hypothetical protein